MRKFFRVFDGSQTLVNGPVFWGLFLLSWVALLAYPLYGSEFGASNLALFFLYVPLALGLSLLWGFGGVLSFGQMAFFGIGGYVYGIITINMAPNGGLGTLVGVTGGLITAALPAAVFGYFMFYGEVSGWIIPLLTLVLSLVLEVFLGQTAGYQWRVGEALLGGYNGMTDIPSLLVGSGSSYSFFYFTLALIILIYIGLRALVNSRTGTILVAVREDMERARMLGHNVDRLQVEIFTLAAILAAFSGILYAAWGNYIDPSTMNLFSAALPVIWVAVGGRQSLTAVLLSTVLLGYFDDFLSVYGGEYAFVVNGTLLVVVMMFFPFGIFYTLARRSGLGATMTKGMTATPERSLLVEAETERRIVQAAARANASLLHVERLEKAFGGVRAVNGLDFTMHTGELRCVIGPNGAGKSTFFSLLTGLHEPDRGRILFKENEITNLPPYQRVRRGMGLKFQTTRVYGNLPVEQNLRIPLRRADANRNGTIAWAVAKFGLDKVYDIPARETSHAHQQWLEICLALATGPDLLLLDEPTAGMTEEESRITADFLRILNQQGVAILVVEHNMGFVRELDSHVDVLHNGRLFASGTIAEVEANKEVQRIYLGE